MPQQIGDASDWLNISAGDDDTCGIRADHTLQCWGYNRDGQLGTGDTQPRDIPTMIGTDLTWDTVSTGYYHTCGVQLDHTAYCWGFNGYGPAR